MREKKWTPGPWVYTGRNAPARHIRSASSNSNIGTVYICKQARANGNLIAAAPELVEALEKNAESLSDMLEAFGNMMREDEFTFHKGRVERARAALAKAYGEDA